MLLSTLLLQATVSFNPAIIYNILTIIVVLLTGAGFIFNMKSEIRLLRNDLHNTKSDLTKLEQNTKTDYNKIETKINLIEEKIEQLPVNITNLIKNFLKN
jgi:hypothetical protein